MGQPLEVIHNQQDNAYIGVFPFSLGHKIVRERKLERAFKFKEVHEGTHYLTNCDKIFIKVQSSDFPDVTVRQI